MAYSPANTTDVLISKIEQERGEGLTQEEQDQIEIWEKGRQLAAIPPFALETIFEMIDSYAIDSMMALSRVSPGEKEKVAAQHAIYFALNQLATAFRNDVMTAINESRTPPEILRQNPDPSN